MNKTVELADPTYKGKPGSQHFGGCHVESVDVNRSGFCPMGGSWELAFEDSAEDRRDPLRNFVHINDIPDTPDTDESDTDDH